MQLFSTLQNHIQVRASSEDTLNFFVTHMHSGNETNPDLPPPPLSQSEICCLRNQLTLQGEAI